MHHKDIKIGDRVRLMENPDLPSPVVRQWIKLGREYGTVTEKWESKEGVEFRVRVNFNDRPESDDLWTVSINGEYKTLVPV